MANFDGTETSRVEARFGVLIFPGFELLDVFGPLEMFAHSNATSPVTLIGEQAGAVASAQGPEVVAQYSLAKCPNIQGLLVPGGIGTRQQVHNRRLLEFIAARARDVKVLASVCTGAALLAKAGTLDGRRATTNKWSFNWVAEQGPNVDWVKHARWVEDGAVFTSSGVSAGIDMALAIIARLNGPEAAEIIASHAEYDWHRDADWDPFAKQAGLVD